MKRFIAFLVFVGVFWVHCDVAKADNGYTYLGGAQNMPHCQIMAGNAGFAVATFGGYVNGIYFWNACFGSVKNTPTYGWYTVFLYDGEDRKKCKEKVYKDVSSATCELDGNDTFPRLVCEIRRSDERDLKRVSCVEKVVGPFSSNPRN
jgi:hypothetical protein